MFIDLNTVDIYVKPGTTDMRKQINGLSVLVQQELKLDPFSGALFVFCNRRRHLVKVLYWDRTGFALWMKRLEKARFPWPMNRRDAEQLNVEQFRQLLSGIDFWSAHEELNYTMIY
jgi:transposase